MVAVPLNPRNSYFPDLSNGPCPIFRMTIGWGPDLDRAQVFPSKDDADELLRVTQLGPIPTFDTKNWDVSIVDAGTEARAILIQWEISR